MTAKSNVEKNIIELFNDKNQVIGRILLEVSETEICATSTFLEPEYRDERQLALLLVKEFGALAKRLNLNPTTKCWYVEKHWDLVKK